MAQHFTVKVPAPTNVPKTLANPPGLKAVEPPQTAIPRPRPKITHPAG